MKKFIVYVDERLCKGCELCVFYCPKDVLKLAEKMNQNGYNVAEVIDLGYCTGCRLCEIACPDFAIYIEEDHEEKP
ncbi:MAG TPA: 4Fe-4S dicluster domain-containing protein [Dehalococcoidales bacterium]|jgi:2-oxoglutarate ferredoxin oxidoreductase subunit delta